MCSNKRTNTWFPLILFILVGENHSGKINTQDREGERERERERERQKQIGKQDLVNLCDCDVYFAMTWSEYIY